MAVPYNHREVEKKWQTVWDDEKAFKTSDDFSKPKYYALVEFRTGITRRSSETLYRTGYRST